MLVGALNVARGSGRTENDSTGQDTKQDNYIREKARLAKLQWQQAFGSSGEWYPTLQKELDALKSRASSPVHDSMRNGRGYQDAESLLVRLMYQLDTDNRIATDPLYKARDKSGMSNRDKIKRRLQYMISLAPKLKYANPILTKADAVDQALGIMHGPNARRDPKDINRLAYIPDDKPTLGPNQGGFQDGTDLVSIFTWEDENLPAGQRTPLGQRLYSLLKTHPQFSQTTPDPVPFLQNVGAKVDRLLGTSAKVNIGKRNDWDGNPSENDDKSPRSRQGVFEQHGRDLGHTIHGALDMFSPGSYARLPETVNGISNAVAHYLVPNPVGPASQSPPPNFLEDIGVTDWQDALYELLGGFVGDKFVHSALPWKSGQVPHLETVPSTETAPFEPTRNFWIKTGSSDGPPSRGQVPAASMLFDRTLTGEYTNARTGAKGAIEGHDMLKNPEVLGKYATTHQTKGVATRRIKSSAKANGLTINYAGSPETSLTSKNSANVFRFETIASLENNGAPKRLLDLINFGLARNRLPPATSFANAFIQVHALPGPVRQRLLKLIFSESRGAYPNTDEILGNMIDPRFGDLKNGDSISVSIVNPEGKAIHDPSISVAESPVYQWATEGRFVADTNPKSIIEIFRVDYDNFQRKLNASYAKRYHETGNARYDPGKLTDGQRYTLWRQSFDWRGGVGTADLDGLFGSRKFGRGQQTFLRSPSQRLASLGEYRQGSVYPSSPNLGEVGRSKSFRSIPRTDGGRLGFFAASRREPLASVLLNAAMKVLEQSHGANAAEAIADDIAWHPAEAAQAMAHLASGDKRFREALADNGHEPDRFAAFLRSAAAGSKSAKTAVGQLAEIYA